MSQSQPASLPCRLARAARDAARLQARDKDALIALGVTLEQLLSANEPAVQAVTPLLQSALATLQTLFMSPPEEPAPLLTELRANLDAAAACIPPVDEPAEPADAAAGVADLDDIAAALMQIQPGDREALETLAQSVRGYCHEPACQPELAPLVEHVADIIAQLLERDLDDWDTIVRVVGQALEAVMKAAEAPAAGPLEPASSPRAPEPEASEAAPAVPDSAWGALPIEADRELLAEFILEARDNIAGAEASLLELEANPDDPEAINTVFRAFHTIKGTSAFLGLVPLNAFAHRAESLLSQVRDGALRCVGPCADLALQSVDMLKDLVQRVQDALGGAGFACPEGFDSLMQQLARAEKGQLPPDPPDLGFVPRVGDILVSQGRAEREDVERVARDQGPAHLGEAILRANVATVTDVAHALRTQQRVATESADSSVRVRTDRLDRLIEAVGELVIAHSMIAQDQTIHAPHNHELAKKVGRTGKIVRELQDLGMSMRMVPLKATFQKMARLARDVAQKSGRSVSFITEGEDTEIDRNMVDVVNDPLVHMVRNAVDHGIEPPDDRRRLGKPASGTVCLSACYSGGNVVVEVRDDGRGLDRDRIVHKAVARGLIESDKGMTDSQVFGLVFEPGFSTAEQITEVSGRGVGLDVVRRNVEAIRGRIEISSEPGRGSVFSMRLPLTLAVTDGMLVRVGSERYIIPTLHIEMSFRPRADQISTVEGRGEMALVREELLPIYRLGRLFGIPGSADRATDGLLVIVDSADRRYALLVDELLGQHQVVAKPLGDGIGRIPGVTGGAILGDGRVGLILDPQGVCALARDSARPSCAEFELVQTGDAS
jgi:two-component system chemotaxis sensor kinase CheA